MSVGLQVRTLLLVLCLHCWGTKKMRTTYYMAYIMLHTRHNFYIEDGQTTHLNLVFNSSYIRGKQSWAKSFFIANAIELLALDRVPGPLVTFFFLFFTVNIYLFLHGYLAR